MNGSNLGSPPPGRRGALQGGVVGEYIKLNHSFKGTYSPTTSPRWGTPPPERRRMKLLLLIIHLNLI